MFWIGSGTDQIVICFPSASRGLAAGDRKRTNSSCVLIQTYGCASIGPFVSYSRIALRRPVECRHCHKRGTLSPQQTITGVFVLLSWYCGQCGMEWPITPEEQVLTRRGAMKPERDSKPRPEHRKG